MNDQDIPNYKKLPFKIMLGVFIALFIWTIIFTWKLATKYPHITR